MIVVRKLSDKEPDILNGFEGHKLVITGLNDNVLLIVGAPEKGWTVEKLEAMNAIANSIADSSQESGWNAYLGDGWIGSSEV
ncbi:hypothetical protein HCX89_21355 [Shewanella sp. Iso12]|nr:hypothetical protein [Shewanella sp. Iso12]